MLVAADLGRFFEPLKLLGVLKPSHLKDVKDMDCTAMGMSNPEKTRFDRVKDNCSKGMFRTLVGKMMVRTELSYLLHADSDIYKLSCTFFTVHVTTVKL